MRYVAAAALHQKALKVLSAIEFAEIKYEGFEEDIANFGIVPKNWREELEIFPLGKPSLAQQERTKHDLEITKAAHKRLCKYHQKILSRLIDIA